MGKGGVYPITEAVEMVDGNTSQEIQRALKKLYDLPKVSTNSEISKRIDSYFQFCEDNKLRPGVSQLALALGVSRGTLWNWSEGKYCDDERKRICSKAISFIQAYVEQLFVSQKINPVSGIFLMKVWNGWKETTTLEMVSNNSALQADKTPEEIEAEIVSQIPVDED